MEGALPEKWTIASLASRVKSGRDWLEEHAGGEFELARVKR